VVARRRFGQAEIPPGGDPVVPAIPAVGQDFAEAPGARIVAARRPPRGTAEAVLAAVARRIAVLLPTSGVAATPIPPAVVSVPVATNAVVTAPIPALAIVAVPVTTAAIVAAPILALALVSLLTGPVAGQSGSRNVTLDDLCRLMLKAIDDSAWRVAARGAGPGHTHRHYTWDHAAALVVQHALAPT